MEDEGVIKVTSVINKEKVDSMQCPFAKDRIRKKMDAFTKSFKR